jgi:hypothetical protein
MPKERCDCTAYCGDDPWLEQGKSIPCERVRGEELVEKAARKSYSMLSDFARGVGIPALDFDELSQESQSSWKKSVRVVVDMTLGFAETEAKLQERE